MSYTISDETKRSIGLGLTAAPVHRNHRRRRKSSRLLITALGAAALTACLYFIC